MAAIQPIILEKNNSQKEAGKNFPNLLIKIKILPIEVRYGTYFLLQSFLILLCLEQPLDGDNMTSSFEQR